MRPLSTNDRARVPFAMVAVLMLMLSAYSMAYMGGIQRQEAGEALVGAEVARQKAVLEGVEDRMALEGFYIASRSVAAATMFLCDQTMLDASFRENYSAYLEKAFPMFVDPYLVEVRGFEAAVFMEERTLRDLVPSNRTVESNVTLKDGSGTEANATVEVLDTVTTEECNETSALARYVVVGSGNCTVRNTRSGAASERPISFERGMDSPFPLMNSKAAALDSAGECNAMGLARSVKYILTTVAQFRVLEGYGSGLNDAPGGTSDILTLDDVQLAVNLAVILETVRAFRDYDEAVALEMDSLGLGAAGTSLGGLLDGYLRNGTLDPADIVALYTGIGDREIPAGIILAQAFNAIIDQFILKYLDYFGIMDIANSVYKTGQELKQWIEDMGQGLSDFIFWDDGEGRDEAEQVTGWLIGESAGMAWPPMTVSAWGLDRGADPASPTDLAALDVYQPIGSAYHYSGACRQLVSESSSPIIDGGVQIGVMRHASLSVTGIGADTLSTPASDFPEGYLADFKPASMLRQTDDVLALWKTFYDEHYADGEDVIYATIRDAVKNVTQQMAGLIMAFLGQSSVCLSGYGGGEHAIDPADRDSALQDMRDMLDDVLGDAADYLIRNPGAVSQLLSVLTDRQSQLTLRLIEFVSANYDVLAGKDAQVAAAQHSLGLSMLLNATWAALDAGSAYADYAVYNEIGHSMGYVDDPLPYDCTAAPGDGDYARALLGQCWANLSADMLPYAESAFAWLRDAECRFERFGDPGNGMYVEALEGVVDSKPDGILARFVGSDPSSLIGLARGMVVNVLDGIIWSGEVADTQYAPELVFSDAGAGFEMWEGGRGTANAGGGVWKESFVVRQPDGMALAVPSGTGAGLGELEVGISAPAGVHFTDVASFNERPFENRWNVTVRGAVRLAVSSASAPHIIDGAPVQAEVTRDLGLDMEIPVLAYSGWDLVGVDYTSTATLAGDVEKLLDLVSAFFDWVWESIAGPINWLVDQVMKVVDFFADLIGTLLSYASDIMEQVTDLLCFLVEKVQQYLKELAGWVFDSIIGWVDALLPDGAEFRFGLFGFDFVVRFATDGEMDRMDAGEAGVVLSVRTDGKLLGTGFDVGMEIWDLDSNTSAEEGMEYDVLLDAQLEMAGFRLDIGVDPFMVLQDKIVECRGEGGGWRMELDAPVPEIPYDKATYSLHDIAGVGAALSNIPIPFLGVKASINAGVEISYTLKGLEEDNPVINEVELNPRGLDNGTQWAELYNPLAVNASLENWTLSFGNRSWQNVTFNASAVMEPFGYWMVQYPNLTLPTSGVTFELLDPGGKVVDRTPRLSEPDGGVINNISIGDSGCDATWQRSPNGANLTLAGKWNFTRGSIGAANAAVDVQLRAVVMALLKGAFNSTWNDLKGEQALSLDFVVKLVTQFVQRFIEDVLTVIERSVVETALFLDVMLTDISGTGGGGIKLSFVIEGGDTLAELLRWVIGSVSAFLAKFGKPTQPAQYPKLGADVPEHLYIRLEFYGMVQMPGVMRRAAGADGGEPQTVRLAGRIEANIPALAALVGREMGRWRINFGVYIENVPPDIADPLFQTGNKTVNVWLFKGTAWET